MNSNIISSDMAAPTVSTHVGPIAWPEEWVTARTVIKRFGFCERTLRTYVAHGMPKHQIGKRQMRFVLREVHDWLLREGALRFAAIGLANTVRASTQPQGNDVRSISVNVPANLQITNTTARRNRKRH
jgi:hypothetical protein